MLSLSVVWFVTVFLFTGRPARSAAMPVLFLLGGPKIGFFAPQGTRCPDKLEIWHWGADQRSKGPLPRAKFPVYRGRNVGIQPQNCQNFEFWQ